MIVRVLSDLLMKRPMNLIVSLPANSIEMARAAAEAGADVIKVHMNVEHRASGNTFGTLEENKEFFQELNQLFKGPTGIVPGDSPEKVKQDELKQLKEFGFNFLSIYAHTAPAWLLENNDLEKMIALSNHYTSYELNSFKTENIDILEASVMEPTAYGTALSLQDLLHYNYLLSTIHQPIVIPTQKKIELTDLKALYKIGVHGLMIGAVVTGKSADQIYATTKAYKQEITRLRM